MPREKHLARKHLKVIKAVPELDMVEIHVIEFLSRPPGAYINGLTLWHVNTFDDTATCFLFHDFSFSKKEARKKKTPSGLDGSLTGFLNNYVTGGTCPM